ncbi:MAG: IMPACT family protein [Bacteroidia bacterium]
MSSLFSDTYNEIENNSETQLRERGSKFISFSFKVYSDEEIKNNLQSLKQKYPDASHHCYAYILGQGQEAQRANDDGEPTGSAGRPILRAILSQELTNVMVVVVRYFGGTLLGIPGLISSYGDGAKSVLNLSGKIEKVQQVEYEVSSKFENEQEIHKLLKPFDFDVKDRAYTEKVTYKVAIRRSQAEAFEKGLKEAYLLESQFS